MPDKRVFARLSVCFHYRWRPRAYLSIAAYIAVCAVLSLIATALMTDYTGKDIEGEYTP